MAGSVFSSSLDAVNYAVRAGWKTAFSEAQNKLPYGSVSTDLGQSKNKHLAIDFMGEVPDMQDVTTDSLRESGMRRYSWTLSHKVYKIGLRIGIPDLDTDSLQMIQPRINGLARKVAGHPARLGFDQLELNPTAYDGTALFSTTRTWGSGANYDNLRTGTGVGASNIETDLATVRTGMMQAEDDQGEAMENAPNVLIIPSALEPMFRKVLVPLPVAANNATTMGVIPPTLGNVWTGGGYTVITLGRLTDANDWYALHVGEELNPFIYSWISPPKQMNTPSMNDDSAITNDVLRYVFRGHYAVGVTLPQYFMKVTN